MNEGAVRVKGLKELTRAFAKMSVESRGVVFAAFTKVAEPVARDAAQLAYSSIRNIDERWSSMKVGVAKSAGVVYVAPGARRRRGPARPNLGTLLMNRAMQPSLDQHADEIEAAAVAALDELAATNGF